MEKEILILGIKIDDVSKNDIEKHIISFLNNNEFNLIFTPNPEICLKSIKNSDYRHVLNDGDIKIPDGVGLKLGAEILDQKLKHKITGVDLTNRILQKHADESIFIINKKNGLSDINLIKKVLKEKYPNIKVDGMDTDISEIDKIANELFDKQPSIIFSTLGAPDQETLLHKLKFTYKIKAKLGLAVGGSFDFITGKQTRAPKWWQDMGMEWFFRLIKQPKRLGRITDATIKFPLECKKWKHRMETEYRQNVMAIIVNKGRYLIQKNPRFGENHWQFPQGGIDENEDEQVAAMREASEETGIEIDKLKTIKSLPEKHTYKYPRWHQLLNGYIGQIQAIYLIEYTGEIDEVNFRPSYEAVEIKWVTKDELLEYIHPNRHKSLKKILPFLD